MSKEESNLKSRIKGFFGLKEKQAPLTYQRPQTKEIIFTPEVLREIGPESPANNRIRTIKELSDVVLHKKLEENAIEALWGSIKDLVDDKATTENRQVALHFLECLLRGQLIFLGIRRAHFFHVIEKLTKPSDRQQRLQLFSILSQDGRNLDEFEEEAGHFLLKWMPIMVQDEKQHDFFVILINVIKFNAAYLDEEVVSGIVKNTCIISSRNRSENEIKLCLDLLDAVVCYSYLPTACLQNFVAALCRMINYPKYSSDSWELMRKLLGTHLGHSSIYTMCCILQDRCQQIDQNLLRGAVFFIGMALWGSKKVTTLKHTYSSVLPSFLQVLSTNSFVVAYEVVLSIQRLVKKYGKDLQHVEWSIILDILEVVLKMIESTTPQSLPDPRMQAELHDVLTVVETLHEHGQFTGCVARFFKIIEMCANKRPESSVSMLIEYHAQLIHPGKENWVSNLYQLLDKYFRNEARTQIRVKALDKLSFVLSINKHMHEDELINTVVLPQLSHIETDRDPLVRKVAADMLLTLAQSCSDQCFMDIIGLLEKIISRPMIARLTSPYPTAEGSDIMQQTDETHLIDIKTALFGLVELFKVKLFVNPSSHCLKLYDILVTHMKHQYSDPRQYDSQSAAQIRKQILSLLLDLRSDSLLRVGFIHKHLDNQLVFSPYITCVESTDSVEEGGDLPSPSTTDSAAFQWSESAHLCYTPSFMLFTSCLENDKDWQVLECVLVNMPLLLQNKTLILSTRRELIDHLCHQLCAMVNDRQLGFPEKLKSVPPGRFTRSDFHTFVFPVLSSMVTYHKYLDRSKQRELIKCLEFGLVSKCAKICTNSLRICTLEMQEVMMRLLPSVLLQLSKISATVYMAIPVLAFLSSIVRLPKMYANFVEDEYMSVFAIALPYTNPFKFSHYTVSLAYHVITIWFIRCRLPFRKSFVKFIQKGMRANVIQQFKENSMLNDQNQDSSDRSRSSSYNEAASHSRKRVLSGSSRIHHQFHPPVDSKDSQFHMELTETCLDVMARYAFGNFNAIPNRSPVAKFLLEGGQSQMWLLGNKVVTITTSGGGGAKGTTGGLCEKCIAYYQGNTQNPNDKAAPSMSQGRRRHKSAMTSRSSASLDIGGRAVADDLLGQQRALDDMSIKGEASHEQDVGVQTGSSLSESTPKMGLETEALESYLYGLKKQSTDGRVFQSHMCNCWCTGWAEVYIRAPSGNTSWMMRIENEPALTSLQDSQVPDITMLFASVQKKRHPDLDSLTSRIDSGSIGEEEYESLYDQHFPSDHSQDGRGLADDNDLEVYVDDDIDEAGKLSSPQVGSPGCEKKEVDYERNGLDIPASKLAETDGHRKLMRYNSSPSLISSNSSDALDAKDLDPRDALSETVVVEVNKHEYEVEESPQKSAISDNVTDKTDGASLTSEKEQKSKSIDINATGVIKNSHLTTIPSPSPVSSEASSNFDELSDLPAIRKVRGHTVSVAQPSKDSRLKDEVSGLKTKGTGVKDTGRGGVNPSFVFLQLYHGGILHTGGDAPILLPQNEAIVRAVSVLDRVHPFETHKIGVVYVGPRQTKDEKSILSNRYGSERYAQFVHGLGQLIRLSDCDPSKVYVGGLDTSGKDGLFAFGWQDESMHVIFHVATLMPNRESDPNCNAKKLHIGNDYVTIVYNDSGEDYKIGVIKGHFNYVNIVIKPLDYETNTVTLQAKEDIADTLGHKDTKVISDQNLAALVRQIAVNCDLASLVLQRQQTQPQDPYASNWLERLRKIRGIRTKVNAEDATSPDKSPDVHVSKSPTHSRFDDFTNLV